MHTATTNRTGGRLAGDRLAQMMDTEDLTTSAPNRSGTSAEAIRSQALAAEACLGGCSDGLTGMEAELNGLLDKLGARLGFERCGTRLYEALLRKTRMLAEDVDQEDGLSDELLEIRDEEAEHVDMVQRAILELGGDPTLETPAADVEAVIGSGLNQVINDPRTSLGQCLHAVLIAELADQDAWGSLIAQADGWVSDGILADFRDAEAEERVHVTAIRRLLRQAEAAEEAEWELANRMERHV